jgi:hypothetical protein
MAAPRLKIGHFLALFKIIDYLLLPDPLSKQK